MIQLIIHIEETEGVVRMSSRNIQNTPTQQEVGSAYVLDSHLKKGLAEIIDKNGGAWAEGQNSEKICTEVFNRFRKNNPAPSDSMKRPKLNEIPIPQNPFLPGTFTITVSPGQWDNVIKSCYEAGHLLLEIENINGQDTVVRAYKRK